VGYMTVDTEGSENAFLRDFDFDAFPTQLLQVECNKHHDCKETYRILKGRFRILKSVPFNNGCAHNICSI
jgi:mannose-6-phosphate isomerase-like protein (cupin superfamily)